MIEIPADKAYADFEDSALSKFLSDKKNQPLKEAFEKAAKAQLGFAYGKIQVFADNKEDLTVIKATLQELADELKTIPEARFQQIIGQMKKTS